MPLYEYRCQSCGHQYEVLQRLGEGAEGQQCPDCGHQQVARLFSTFAASTGGGQGEAAMSAGGCGPGAFT